MKNIKVLYSLVIASIMLFSCEKYDDYIEDFDYSTVYFATQKPLRTVVARDVMEFKFGVALGGKRENTVDEKVQYVVDPELLTTVEGADAFTLLPEEYYNLSNSGEFVVEAGSYIGDVTLTFNKELFTSDPLAISSTYALPVRIIDASVDSVLAGHDYSIIVVKYQSAYHGHYYSKGMQEELDAAGNVVNTIIYSESDLSQNEVVDFSTLGSNLVKTSRIGNNISGGLLFTMNSDGSVTVESEDVVVQDGSAVAYDASAKTYSLDITVDKNGTKYHIVEELILRQDPELDLRFVEW